MSDSSQPKDSFSTLTINGKSIDEIINECTIDVSAPSSAITDDTITITGSSGYNYSSGISTITLSPTLSTIDNISISPIDVSQFSFNFNREWVDKFPELARVEDMCKKYPGLKIAFDNFKVFYEMCKDDYDNPTPKK